MCSSISQYITTFYSTHSMVSVPPHYKTQLRHYETMQTNNNCIQPSGIAISFLLSRVPKVLGSCSIWMDNFIFSYLSIKLVFVLLTGQLRFLLVSYIKLHQNTLYSLWQILKCHILWASKLLFLKFNSTVCEGRFLFFPYSWLIFELWQLPGSKIRMEE